MIVLVDHNLEGHARRMWGVLAAEGWIDLLPLRMTTLQEEKLPANADDSVV